MFSWRKRWVILQMFQLDYLYKTLSLSMLTLSMATWKKYVVHRKKQLLALRRVFQSSKVHLSRIALHNWIYPYYCSHHIWSHWCTLIPIQIVHYCAKNLTNGKLSVTATVYQKNIFRMEGIVSCEETQESVCIPCHSFYARLFTYSVENWMQ